MTKETNAKILALIQLAHKDNNSVNVATKLQELYLEILDQQVQQQPRFHNTVQLLLLIGTFAMGLVVAYALDHLFQ